MRRFLPFFAVLVAVLVTSTTIAVAYRMGRLPSRPAAEVEPEGGELVP